MKLTKTGDGSFTYLNIGINETYHSKSGALEESFYKFAIPALENKLKMKKIKILDICFGLGYNSVAAIS